MSAGPVDPAPPPARRPGLAGQRTALAWQRTGLSVVTSAVLVAVVGVRLRALPLTLAAVTVGTAVAGLMVWSALGRPPRSRSPWPAMVLIVAGVVMLGLAGAAAGVLALVGDV